MSYSELPLLNIEIIYTPVMFVVSVVLLKSGTTTVRTPTDSDTTVLTGLVPVGLKIFLFS
ncbi:uncharacterized protein METZ01_LOCUS164014 [marine metagenome]|uniref:Uncharacterized protein n=1 Tax=marine metagenome TaxID=408172 RepID=A0A382BBE5_9ZZZZ